MMLGRDETTRGTIRRVFADLSGASARQGIRTLVDQAIVSGTRFTATIVIGRIAGVEELGLYAIGFSIIMVVNVVQESLLMSPYTILGRREKPQSRRRFAGSVFVLSLWLSLIAAPALALFGLLAATMGVTATAWLSVTLAWVIPCVLLHNFARKMCFAHLRVGSALLLDLGVALVQLAGLAYLAWTVSLTAVTALGAMGTASALIGFVWLSSNRRDLAVRRKRILPQLSRNWRFGRWVLGTQQVVTLGASMILWLISALAGTAAAGIFAACSIVITAANPLSLGLGNLLEPKTAGAVATRRFDKLLGIVNGTTALMAVALGIYWTVLLVLGSDLIEWIFANPLLRDQGHLVVVLGTVVLLRGINLSRSVALRALGLPNRNFVASSLNLAMTLLTAYPLIDAYGALGGGYAVLLGTITGAILRFWFYARATRLFR